MNFYPLKLYNAELLEMSSRPDTFSYAELRSATEDFDPSNKLGEGGFGPVFKVSIFFNFCRCANACWKYVTIFMVTTIESELKF